MITRKTLIAWCGILAISSLFLLGQEAWSPCSDFDGDGYGNPASAACTYPGLDCDDDDPGIHPGAVEALYGSPVCYDGLDNDCDGFADLLDDGCAGPDMAWIPPGCFQMGDAFHEGDLNEVPVHTVCVSPFEMDIHQVTNGMYAQCVKAGACAPPVSPISFSRSDYYGNPAYDAYPVVMVSWHNAVDYCAWAGKRLPTEAQWEYAARGGLEGKRYSWGDTISGSLANYWNSGDPEDNDTNAVGSYPANGFGLYDTTGNLWEWVYDWFGETYYPVSPVQDPQGPETGYNRVLRGGSWDGSPDLLRVSGRGRLFPTLRSVYHGFRCAR